jgi:hypothetical protein
LINYQVFNDKAHFEENAPKMLGRIGAFWNWQNKMVLKHEVWTEPRSKSQLGLYRMWLTKLADYFSTKDQQFSDDDMHDLMRHKFLGYETKTVGNTVIKDQLKSTANGAIGKTEMSEYMTKLDIWATEMECYLPHPEDNEYSKYREAQI